MGHYRITITDPDDVVLDSIPIDGIDLRRQGHRFGLAESIQSGMGGDAVAACAALPPVDEED